MSASPRHHRFTEKQQNRPNPVKSAWVGLIFPRYEKNVYFSQKFPTKFSEKPQPDLMVRETNACLPALCRRYSRGLSPVLEQGGGGKSDRPWQQKKPLSNCKPTPGRRKSAEKTASFAADIVIIANNRNTSRAEAGRGASAFMQIDEHEAGNGRTRAGTAPRRLFALFSPLLQFLSYCKNTSRLCISLSS